MMDHRIALLVDFDNAQIAASDENFKNCAASAVWARSLVRAVENQCSGQVDIRRVYGNTLHHVQDTLRNREWNPKTLRDNMDLDVKIQDDLSRHGFQVLHCPTGAGRKNRADILMALDCMEIASNYSHIDTFAILSHDSDFSALIQRLRAIGKKVVIVTVGKMEEERSRILTALANTRVNYDQQVIDDSGSKQLLEVLEEVRQQPNGFPQQGVTVDTLKARIRQKQPDFHPQDLGFAKMTDFVDECLDSSLFRYREGRVHLVANGKAKTTENANAAKVPAVGNQAADKVKAPTPASAHETKVRGLLAVRNIRFHAPLRETILQWISRLGTAHYTKGVFPTFGGLQDELRALPELAEFSKSKISDCMNVLKHSGALKGEWVEGKSIKDTVITGCLSLHEARLGLLKLATDVLSAGGIPLTEAEVPLLAELIFGEDTKSTRSALMEMFVTASPTSPSL